MFHLPSASFQNPISDSIKREYTNLTYSEEMFCLLLLSSSDGQLKWNIVGLDPYGLEYRNIMFTSRDGLGLFVKSDFAITALYSEAHYRNLKI